MPKKVRDIISGLGRKGFRSQENDHTFLHLWVAGRKTPVWTKISHGEKEIGDRLLAVMARQLRITRQEFNNLVDCPLSEAAYVQMLREGEHIG